MPYKDRRTGHQGGLNPPGYVSPSREGKRYLVSPVTDDLFAAMHEAAAREGTTIGKTIERLCENFIREHSVKVRNRNSQSTKPPTPRR